MGRKIRVKSKSRTGFMDKECQREREYFLDRFNLDANDWELQKIVSDFEATIREIARMKRKVRAQTTTVLPERQGEIALRILKHILREEHPRVDLRTLTNKEVIKSLAKWIRVPAKELVSFFGPIAEEVNEYLRN